MEDGEEKRGVEKRRAGEEEGSLRLNDKKENV